MYSRQSLVIILLSIALTAIGPSLSVQGAMAVPKNGQNRGDGNADSTSTAKGVKTAWHMKDVI